MSSALFNKIFGTSAGGPQPDFSQYADWLRWRAGRFTAGPPQLLSQYGIIQEDWRIKPVATLHGLAELTGVPTLYRWWQAILQNRPIADVEKEYFGRISKELQQAGINVDEQTLAARINQATMHGVLTALPLAVPFSKAEAAALAKSLGVGFGLVGGPTAIIRAEQGHKEEALRAFVETGLAGTVLADMAVALKDLAAGIAPERLGAVRQQILRQQRQLTMQWRDPEGEAFMRQIEEALLALKKGDTSKYDALVRQFEEWQKTINEFNRLYEAKQKGPLSPEDEARYTKLLQEVAKIRDKYDILKSYIDTAREMGIETHGRALAAQLEFEGRTLSDLASAAGEMPPGPPVRDVLRRLQEMDLEHLLRLSKDPKALSRFAKRFGVDEQILAEQVAGVLRSRQWERLSQLPPDELSRMLTDREMLRKAALDYGLSEDELMARIEEFLRQRKLGVTKTEPQPPETWSQQPPDAARPPIEPIRPPERPPTEFRPPETEVETGRGQVLIVKTEEEPRLTVRRLEELPSVEARLRYLLRRRGRPEPTHRPELVEPEVEPRLRQEQELGSRSWQEPQRGPKSGPRQEPGQGPKQEPGPRYEPKVEPKQEPRQEPRVETERVVVVTERELVRFVPYLPPQLLALPVAAALPAVAQIISQVVGAPVSLRLPPPPSGSMPLGAYLRSILPRGGFGGAQREVYVLL